MNCEHEAYVGPVLAYATQLCKRRLDQSMKDLEVTQMQARVLLHLMRMEAVQEVRQKDLEEKFQIRGSTVTGLVERLEEKGLLVREYGRTDGRCRILRTTEKGKLLQKEMMEHLEETEHLMLQGFSAADTARLRGLLQQVIENLKESEETNP